MSDGVYSSTTLVIMRKQHIFTPKKFPSARLGVGMWGGMEKGGGEGGLVCGWGGEGFVSEE